MAKARLFHTTAISAANITGIMAVEQNCFKIPWNLAAGAAELAITGGGGYAVTCGNDESIAGYIFYRVIIDEMHILKVATAPPWRKQRIASELLQKTIDLAREKGLRRICLEVRASNTAAINLYQKFEFASSGRRPGYYDNREDAILMSKEIAECPSWRQPPGGMVDNTAEALS